MPTATEKNGKVLLRVRPRGFCAGVVRAVDIVELALEAYGAPVYVHHEIVHNTYVVEQLRRRGAIFVEAIERRAAMATSWSSAPTACLRPFARKPRIAALKVIDATCPLVTKVHLEALKFAREKRTIILIGHKDHQEIVGTSGEAPDRTIVVDSVDAVDALEVEDPEKLSFLTQTTLEPLRHPGNRRAAAPEIPGDQGPRQRRHLLRNTKSPGSRRTGSEGRRLDPGRRFAQQLELESLGRSRQAQRREGATDRFRERHRSRVARRCRSASASPPVPPRPKFWSSR